MRKVRTIEQMHEIAKFRGGECLSTEYKGPKEKLTWKCNKDHIFELRLSKVKSENKWCKFCNKQNKEREIENEYIRVG